MLKLYTGFLAFFLWSPLGNYEKKSCLNELKFWEASRNHKSSICWKFQYSNSKNGESPPKSISSFPNRDPLLFANRQKLPLRTCTLIVLGSEFEGLHWNMPLWDLLTFWMISELTVTPGRQCWLKIKRTLLWLSLFDHSDTSTSWNITRVCSLFELGLYLA